MQGWLNTVMGNIKTLTITRDTGPIYTKTTDITSYTKTLPMQLRVTAKHTTLLPWQELQNSTHKNKGENNVHIIITTLVSLVLICCRRGFDGQTLLVIVLYPLADL